jgi:hypothetical protein
MREARGGRLKVCSLTHANSDKDRTRDYATQPEPNSSGLNLLNRRIQAFQLHTRVGGREVPIGFRVGSVAPRGPSGHLFLQRGALWDAAGDSLAREHTEFGFREVQPAAVLGAINGVRSRTLSIFPEGEH